MSVRMAPPFPLIFLLVIHRVSSAKQSVSYSHSHICALENSSVIMSCTYTYPPGHQIMNVFWTKGSAENVEPPDLSEDPEYSQRLQYLGDKQKNCTIRLSHVTQKDSHMYYFRFTINKPDKKWTGKPGVNLTVTDLQVESPERVTEGDSVRLTCKSSCALTDRATFIWYRNSQPLTERRDRNLRSGRIYSISNISSDDSGEYKCKSRNEHGEKYSDAVTLNIMYPPKSISVSISPSGEIVEGDSVTLNCSSDSNPPAEISWFKGGTFVGSGRIYSISKISSDDSGEYKCKSRNKHGEKDSDAVTLNIMYPPRSVSVSVSGEIVEGDSVTLICSSDSNPSAEISWFKEDQSSSVGSGQSFSALQSGRFYCEAHNQHGSQRSDAVTVTVKGHLVTLYIYVVVICGAAVIIVMLVIWRSRGKKKKDKLETQMNHSRPGDDRYKVSDVEMTEDLYENMIHSRPADDGYKVSDVETPEDLYENMNHSRPDDGQYKVSDDETTEELYENMNHSRPDDDRCKVSDDEMTEDLYENINHARPHDDSLKGNDIESTEPV
ncbi:B-cell receptor CD22-like [Cyprinus carpio]|uniref:B-cell receptor CD22 n=1 Tax=Cyprinus carpio TaxID=7962 RepID=A0A9Q9VVM8_CYPCA|nr:B-cell receptor CD22-like [Cyprinus carpio]